MTDASPRRRVLIFASKLGYQTRSFGEAALRLGAEVRFATDRCRRLDDPWADRAIPVHFERAVEAAAAVVAALGRERPDAIVALGDRPLEAAARAARRLELPWNDPEAVALCRNKLLLRTRLAGSGLNSPRFVPLAPDDPAEAAAHAVRFPAVVKPLVLSASQGVIRADDAEQFQSAVRRVRALMETPEIRALGEPMAGWLLAEDYIPGAEFSLEGLLTAGRLRVLAICDKPDPLEGPYFEETIYTTPSRLPQAQQRALVECAEHACRALGLVHGPVHAEFRVNDRGVWPLEVAPRPIGGLCGRALRFGPGGATLEELLLRHALGREGADWEREPEASGVMMIPVPMSGILEGVEGEAEARAVPGVTELAITARLRDYIAAWPEGSSYLGFLFARGATPEAVERALRTAHARLRFRIVPRLPVEHPAAGHHPRA